MNKDEWKAYGDRKRRQELFKRRAKKAMSESVGPVDVTIVMSAPAELSPFDGTAHDAYTKVFKFTFDTVRDAEDYIKKGTLPESGEMFTDGFMSGGQMINAPVKSKNPLFDDEAYHRKYGH
jgi:hypothetical protein